jgi:hypothetical protein
MKCSWILRGRGILYISEHMARSNANTPYRPNRHGIHRFHWGRKRPSRYIPCSLEVTDLRIFRIYCHTARYRLRTFRQPTPSDTRTNLTGAVPRFDGSWCKYLAQGTPYTGSLRVSVGKQYSPGLSRRSRIRIRCSLEVNAPRRRSSQTKSGRSILGKADGTLPYRSRNLLHCNRMSSGTRSRREQRAACRLRSSMGSDSYLRISAYNAPDSAGSHGSNRLDTCRHHTDRGKHARRRSYSRQPSIRYMCRRADHTRRQIPYTHYRYIHQDICSFRYVA